MKLYDVIVVGAGPAGVFSSFFIIKENPNTKILLLERLPPKKYETYHKICGEAVSQKFEKELYPLTLRKHTTRKIRYVEEHWPGMTLHRKMKGYIINRPSLFRHILKKFNDLGGELQLSGLTGLRIFQDNTMKVKLSDGSFARAKYLVSAEGANSYTRKLLRLPEIHKETAVQYIVDEKLDCDCIKFYFDQKYQGSYKWVFPDRHITKIGYPITCVENPPKNTVQIQSRVIGTDILKEYSYKNIFFVGDAAGQANPFTKGGIRPALNAAKLVAVTISHQEPSLYDFMWKQSPFYMPNAFYLVNKLKEMSNEELYTHMKPFKSRTSIGTYLRILLFYKKYINLYSIYDLCDKFGW